MNSLKSKEIDLVSDSNVPRRPYVKPAFECETVLETVALACQYIGVDAAS